MVLATNGNFYGTTYNQGPNGVNAGTVFKITPSGTLTTLYGFCQQSPHCKDGWHPLKLMQGRDGNFYGVTQFGNDTGTFYKLTPGGQESVLYTFCSILVCKFGDDPTSLMQASDGNFYGLVANGGNDQVGGFWQLLANSWSFNLKYGFDGTIGMNPAASLVQGRDGQLYGVAPMVAVATTALRTAAPSLRSRSAALPLCCTTSARKPTAPTVANPARRSCWAAMGTSTGVPPPAEPMAAGTIFKITSERRR